MSTEVLLVDDVAAERMLVRMAIERSGSFRVVGEAADGGEAIEMAKTLNPDLVVMDLSMPGVDGLEALPGVKLASPLSRVVILSGLAAGDIAETVLGMGADAYIEKGLHPNELVAQLLVFAAPVSDTDLTSDRGRAVETVNARLLVERDRLHRDVIAAAHDGIVLQDANGAIRLANPAAQRMLGGTLAELADRPSTDPRWHPLDEHGNVIPPDELPSRRALITGEPQVGRIMRLTGPDGGSRWVINSAVPLREGDGRPYGVVSSLADVTELRRALQAVGHTAARDTATNKHSES